MITTCGVIAAEDVVSYWAGDLPDEDVDRLDEHLVGCGVCTAASRGVAELAGALAEFVPPFLSHAMLASLRLTHRVGDNVVRPGERRPAVFGASLDILVHRLSGLELTRAATVDVIVSRESTGEVFIAERGVPFDGDSGEILVACQYHFRTLPADVVFEVQVRGATGPAHVTRYPVPHVFEDRW